MGQMPIQDFSMLEHKQTGLFIKPEDTQLVSNAVAVVADKPSCDDDASFMWQLDVQAPDSGIHILKHVSSGRFAHREHREVTTMIVHTEAFEFRFIPVEDAFMISVIGDDGKTYFLYLPETAEPGEKAIFVLEQEEIDARGTVIQVQFGEIPLAALDSCLLWQRTP